MGVIVRHISIPRLLAALLVLLGGVAAYGYRASTDSLIAQLDSALARSQEFAAAKEARIDQLHKKASTPLKDEERLWLNKMLYDEYYVYKADSAMTYVNANIDLARHMGRKDLELEWQINRVFLLTAQGLLSEAEKELAAIDPDAVNGDAKYAYYETAIYLYTHLSQYIGHNSGMTERYDSISGDFRHKALAHITPEHPAYYSLRAAMLTGPDDSEWPRVKELLTERMAHSRLNNRVSAIDAYNLAHMCQVEGDADGRMDNLIKSAIADARMCNRDIASLEELSYIFYEQGDIDRGYAYVNRCLQAALLYPNRVRVVNISSVMDKLQQAAERRNIEQERKLADSLLAVSLLSAVLLLVIVVGLIQFFKLRHAHRRLVDSESQLSVRMDELRRTRDELRTVNRELTDANDKLLSSNERLVESNYVKEEYVGYVFAICSGYLTRIEEFRKNIARKLKVGKIDDVRALMSDERIGQKELQEFYRRFDTTFLHLYPDFVRDFNSLLRPEERITLKKGELLNTELRIYALVRLGINDSVRIAEFLHMSPQTVYNNRLKTRNKAAVPRDEFADHVRRLGATTAPGD